MSRRRDLLAGAAALAGAYLRTASDLTVEVATTDDGLAARRRPLNG